MQLLNLGELLCCTTTFVIAMLSKRMRILDGMDNCYLSLSLCAAVVFLFRSKQDKSVPETKVDLISNVFCFRHFDWILLIECNR